MKSVFLVPLVVVVLALTNPGYAQQWQSETGDDGVWYGAAARPSDYRYGNETMAVYCGGRSPRGLPITEAHAEAVETKPGTFQLSLGRAFVGRQAYEDKRRDDIVVSVDSQPFSLPPFEPNELTGLYDVSVPFSHPIIDGLKGGSRLSVSSKTGPTKTAALRGSSSAINQIERFCTQRQGRRTSASQATPSRSQAVDDAAVSRAIASLRAILMSQLNEACRATGGAGVSFKEGAFVQLDRASGYPDIRLQYQHVACHGGTAPAEWPSEGCGHDNCRPETFRYEAGNYRPATSG